MKPHLITAAAALTMLLLPTLASAQEGERTYLEQGLPAPSQALELSVGTGYTQPFGKLSSGIGMPSVAHEGIGVDGSIGYRVNPRLGVSIGAQYQELNAQNSDATRGMSGTLAAQLHIAPTLRSDPFVELGTGYRLLWIVPNTNNGPTLLEHGFQWLRVRAGLDLRLSPDVAIAPVIGADVTTFLWADAGGNNIAIPSPAISTFVFAGVQGRFDIGGNKVGAATVTSAPAGYSY